MTTRDDIPKPNPKFMDSRMKLEESLFEDRETQGPPLTEFGIALRLLKEGKKLTRKGWNGANQWLELQVPDENSKMSLPYIFITTVQGDRVPWLASQTDMLALDWYCVP